MIEELGAWLTAYLSLLMYAWMIAVALLLVIELRKGEW